MLRQRPARLLVDLAIAMAVLAHYVVPLARLLEPLLAGAALLAIVALGFWIMLIAPFRDRI